MSVHTTLLFTENLESPPERLEMAREIHDWKVKGRTYGFSFLYKGQGKCEGQRCDIVLLARQRVPYSALAEARANYGFWGFREVVLEGKTRVR